MTEICRVICVHSNWVPWIGLSCKSAFLAACSAHLSHWVRTHENLFYNNGSTQVLVNQQHFAYIERSRFRSLSLVGKSRRLLISSYHGLSNHSTCCRLAAENIDMLSAIHPNGGQQIGNHEQFCFVCGFSYWKWQRIGGMVGGLWQILYNVGLVDKNTPNREIVVAEFLSKCTDIVLFGVVFRLNQRFSSDRLFSKQISGCRKPIVSVYHNIWSFNGYLVASNVIDLCDTKVWGLVRVNISKISRFSGFFCISAIEISHLQM